MPFSSRLQLSRRDLLTGLVTLPAATVIGLPAQARDARRVPYELVEDALALPGAAYVGAEHPDVIMIEFFSTTTAPSATNRRQIWASCSISTNISAMSSSTYAILGEALGGKRRGSPSAFQGLYGNDHYRDFHLGLHGRRGVKNGQRALDVAMELGADGHELVEFADSDLVTMAMEAAISAGKRPQHQRHPSFAIGPWIYDGQVPLDGKLRIIDALRA